MFTKMGMALAAATVLGAASGANAVGVPSVDIEKMCRASEEALFGGNTATLDTCLDDEREARQRLMKHWATFALADKLRCVLPAEYLPSYVEWLTCLEMETDYRKIRK
jgi:hypothetical protein